MTKILGLSGKKQSGKNTTANFLHGMEMVSLAYIPKFQINEEGKLVVPLEDESGKLQAGVLDLENKSPSFVEYLAINIWPFIKAYSFADLLKEGVCMNVLGLTREQCYGTESQKNSTTHIEWGDTGFSDKTGPMTAREVMQYVGTDFFRKIYPDVWVDATIRRIEAEGTELAVVTDCRFPNEVRGVQKIGGKVIRLTRDIADGDDVHPSEVALDDFDEFDLVVENSEISASEAAQKIYDNLLGWGWVSTEYQII